MSQTTDTPNPLIAAAQTAQDIFNAADKDPAVDADLTAQFGGASHTAIGSFIGMILAWLVSAGYLPQMSQPVSMAVCGGGALLGMWVAQTSRKWWKAHVAKSQAPARVGT